MRIAVAAGSFLVMTASTALASAAPAKNTIYAEGFLMGELMYSINYERRVVDELGVRVGVGQFAYTTFPPVPYPEEEVRFGYTEARSTYLTIPMTVSYLGAHGKRATFELAGGAIFMVRTGCSVSDLASACGGRYRPLATAFIGFRLHPEELGINFRVGLMLVGGKGLRAKGGDLTVDYEFENGDAFGVIPGPYLSVGASF